MLLALVLNVPAVFLPAFLLSDLGGLGVSYLWFCGVWVGYGLLAAGLLLLLELTVEGKAQARIFMGGAAAVAFALVILEWTVDLRPISRGPWSSRKYTGRSPRSSRYWPDRCPSCSWRG